MVFLSLPGLLLLVIGLCLIVWGFYPLPKNHRSTEIPGFGLQNIYWTPNLRLGDSGYLDMEIIPYDIRDANSVKFEDSGENNHKSVISDDKVLLVESRLELWPALIEPGAELLQTIHPGENQIVTWNITLIESGNFDAELWVYLHKLIEDRTEFVRDPITIQNFEISSLHLFGLSGQQARIFGIIGFLIALLYLSIFLKGFQKSIAVIRDLNKKGNRTILSKHISS